MLCPACGNHLIILELDQIEIDYCHSCGGIWLDAGELELLLEDSAEKDELLSSINKKVNINEKKIRCPICRKKMDKALVESNEPIIIDKCKRGDGLWFDEGELETVVEQGSLDKNNKVIQLLKSMFEHKLKSN